MNTLETIETCKAIVERYKGFTLAVSEGDKEFYTLFLLGNGNIYSLRAGTSVYIMKLGGEYKVNCIALNTTLDIQDLPDWVDSMCKLMLLDNKFPANKGVVNDN